MEPLMEIMQNIPLTIPQNQLAFAIDVWRLLTASRNGDLDLVKIVVNDRPAMAYAQYNYTPPIHFAVCEGHTELVQYLLGLGALDPTYRTYPFLDSLPAMADDRGYTEIVTLLHDYINDPAKVKYTGDYGQGQYDRGIDQLVLEQSVKTGDKGSVKEILKRHPDYAGDETYFWGEGLLSMPAHDNRIGMLKLLMEYDVHVPLVSKWGREYYFKNYEAAKFLLENGMNPNHITWKCVTLLHDMAQLGDIAKATLLLDHGAAIDAIDEEYKSTPLGLACRWGQLEMVELLLSRGADRNKSGAPWSTPLAWARKKGYTEIEKMLLEV
jgi:uncharacterized protein